MNFNPFFLYHVLLFSIFSFEVDPAFLAFMLTVAGGLTWWLIKMYFKIKELQKEIRESREARIQSFADMEKSVQTKIESLAVLVGKHSEEDERKFVHISDNLSSIDKEMGKIGTMAQLIIDGKIKL